MAKSVPRPGAEAGLVEEDMGKFQYED